MKAILLLAVLPACAAFEQPATFTLAAPGSLCLVGQCAQLQPVMDELRDPDFLKRIEEAKPGVPR